MSSYSYEYLYPVAKIEQNGKTKIYVLYQKSVTHLELWLWDPETKIGSKGLLSTYTPASLKILPSQDGFSFIDNGRIRIKRFSRRSPKAIDIYEPIYDLNEMHWIDNNNFYVSAKCNGVFSIFQIDIDGIIATVLQDCENDLMYPQKVGSSMFYIEREIKEGEYKRDHVSYRVLKTEYHVCNDSLLELQGIEDDQERLKKSLEKVFKQESACDKIDEQKSEYSAKRECLVDFKASPLAFLNMISENEGFFLEHSDEVDRHDDTIKFDCHYIKKIDDSWRCRRIFSFFIPSYLIFDIMDYCLYESLLPLLPRYYNNKIYYVDCSPKGNQNLNIFSYDFITKSVEQQSFTQSGAQSENLHFSPIFTKDTIFYGGKMDNAYDVSPKMWINKQGFVCIDLPKITLK